MTHDAYSHTNGAAHEDGSPPVHSEIEYAGGEPSGIEWPHLTKDGSVKGRSQRNIAEFLRYAGVKLRRDAFAHATLVTRNGETSALSNEIARELWLGADALGLPAAEMYFQAVLENTAWKHQFHPVREYLNGLEWEGIPRLDTWLHAYLGAEYTPLNAAYGRKTLIGAVRRVRKPGSKHDTMLVLQGPQGKGKSTAIKALCPLPEYFTDSLHIGMEQKQIIEQTAGKWLVELAELTGLGKRETEAVKASLSRDIDSARMSYGRFATERPRQFVFIGTVNEGQYLRDPTGNRRFWPVTVGRDIDADEAAENIARDRDQLWAEAAYYEARGERSTLPKELWQTAAESQKERLIADPWAEIIEAVIEGKEFVETESIYLRLGVTNSQRNTAISQRIASILGGLGMVRKQRRIGDVRTWGYERVG